MSTYKSQGGRQITVAGVLIYTALWGLIVWLFRESVQLQQGIHTIGEARLSQILWLFATGMLFVAIGLPIAIVAGKKRQAVPVSLGCFLVGFIAIPALIIILMTLDSFGIIAIE